MIRAGELVRSGQMGVDDADLPLELHNLLVSRLGQLRPQVQEVVSQASVLGQEFSVSILEEMFDEGDDDVFDGGELQAVLDAGERSMIWHPVGAGRYSFNHALLRESAYALQFRPQRQALHKAAAQAIVATAAPDQLPFATLARHQDEASEVEQAIKNYIKAGEEAVANYFIKEAHNYYSRGLALATTDKQKLALYLGREAVNHWLGNREEQKEDLRQLVGLTAGSEDKQLLADISLRQTTYGLVTSDYDNARKHAQRARTLAASVEDRDIECQALRRWGRSYWQQGKTKEAEPLIKRALRLAKIVENVGELALSHYDLGMIAFYESRFDTAKEEMSSAATLFLELDDRRNYIITVDLLGSIDQLTTNYESAIAQYERAIQLCSTIFWPYYGEMYGPAHLGDTYFCLSDFERCIEYHSQALMTARRLGDKMAEVVSLDTLGLAYQYQGNTDKAKKLFEEALERHDAIDYPRGKAFLLSHYGLLLINLEALEEAETYLFEAMAIRSRSGDPQAELDTKANQAWLDMARGDIDLSLEAVHDILNQIEENGIDGIELPIQIYWQCYTILNLADHKQEGRVVLGRAYDQLMKIADKIEDDGMKSNYLHNVEHNRRIVAAWESDHL